MSGAANPWMKFHPQDWRADEKLRLCSLAARGLWIEMLAIMHRSERYGQLLVAGIAPTDAQLAVQVGSSADEVAALLAELEQAGVFSRAAKGVIYSRRMTRDHKKAREARNNGLRGGNPSLSKDKGKSGSVKGQDNGEDKGGLKLRGQKPETRKKPSVSTREGKTELPEGWRPEPFGVGTKSRAIVDGWTRDEHERQLEKFTAHHRTRRNRFDDWQQAWSTWALNSPEFSRPAQRTDNGGDFLAHLRREREQREAFESRQATAGGRG